MIFQNLSRVAVSLLALLLVSCSHDVPQGADGGGAPAVSVRVQRTARTPRAFLVAASGTVEAAQTIELGFQVSGRVARVLADEGQSVGKGQVLAELDSADYGYGLQASEGQAAMAQANLEKADSGTRAEELEQARAAYEKAADEYQRYRRLYERQSMAPVDFARVEAGYRAARAQYEMAQHGARREDRAAALAAVRQAQAQVDLHRKRLADTRLIAPIAGMIARRSIDPGETVSAGLPVFSIVNLHPARVRVGVPEADIGRVRSGQRARLSFPSLGGGEFFGVVDLVGVAADPNSRTFTVKISVPNPDLQLKAGMIAEASLETGGMVAAVEIPGDSIVHDPQGSTIVYVYYPDRKRVYARRVETGSVRDRGIEIRSGLSGGELIVVAGQHRLREGLRVEVAP